MFEQIPEIKDNETEALYEQVFFQSVAERILDDFEYDLSTVFSNEEMDQLLEIINGLEDDEQRGVLALPKSIRRKRLEKLRNKYLENGKPNLQKIIADLNENAKKEGYTLGYHISPEKISEKAGDWQVDGTELDDRDDRKMAYYSLDYANLFRKKRGEYLYVVRAIVGNNSAHKRDNTNNWGRADKLSIISELPLSEVDDDVETMLEKKQEIKRAA